MNLDFELELKSVSEAGSFEGLASTGDVDDGGDRVLPGAFANTLAKRGNTRPLLWAHDMAQPIGLGTLAETPEGLKINGTLDLDVQVGREAYSRLKKGIARGLSIGYRAIEPKMEGGIRLLKQVDLFEVSLVAVPMNPHAQVSAVKAVFSSIGDWEDFFRERKFSRSKSKSLAGMVWKIANDTDEPEADSGELAALAWLRERNRTGRAA